MHYNIIIEKYNSLAKPVRASLWFTVCFVFQRGLQFLGMPIYTRIMSPEDYGIYSVFFSWANLICVFSSMNIYSNTFNRAMVKYEKQRDSYISSIQWLTLCIGIVFSIIILGFSNYITKLTGYSLKFQLLLCLHLILFPSLHYWSQKQRFLFEYKKLVAVTLLNSVASLVLGVIFVLLTTEKSFALVAATIAIQAIINSTIFVSLAQKGSTFFNKEFWYWSATTAVVLLPHSLSEILLGHANRLMINQICGPTQAGIYNVVYQISMVMTILRTGINGSFTPWLYYSMKAAHFKNVRSVTNMITILMASLTLFFMLIGPEILKIAAPSSYYESVVSIPAITIGCFFIYIYVLFINLEIYYEQNQFVAVASIATAVFNVVMNYFCITSFGYLSAAYTTMSSYLLMAMMHYGFMQRVAKKNTCIYEIYDIRFLFIISCLLVFAGAVILQLYAFTLLRWLLIITILVSLFINRKRIKTMLKTLKKRE